VVIEPEEPKVTEVQKVPEWEEHGEEL